MKSLNSMTVFVVGTLSRSLSAIKRTGVRHTNRTKKLETLECVPLY